MSHPNDPRRLKDETRDRFALALLASVQMDAPSEGARTRAKAALGLGAPAGFGLLKWLSLASLATASVALSLALTPSPATAQFTTDSASDSDAAPAPAPDSDSDSDPDAGLALPPELPPPAKSSRLPLPAPVARRSSLLEEMALLDAARASLAAHAPTRALATLDDLEHRFPQTTFREEATVLRIEALFAVGDRARAETLARAFLEAHPKSAYARRVRSLLDY
jgi:hypothetical protein